MKRLLSTRSFDGGSRREYPKLDPDDPKDLFPPPESLPFKQALAIIKEHHPDIVHLLGKGIGHELFFHESEILLDALERCREAKIPALSIHDALLVSRMHFKDAGNHMAAAFRKRTKLLGFESEPRIEATMPIPPDVTVALANLRRALMHAREMLCRLDIPLIGPETVWKHVYRNGNWIDERPPIVLCGGKPLPDFTKRDDLRGRPLQIADQLFARYTAVHHRMRAERERGSAFSAASAIGWLMVSTFGLNV